MSNPWIVLAGIVAVGVIYVLLPVIADVFGRFRRSRQLGCPETNTNAEVTVDAKYAALTSAFRHPLLRVKDCSLWPKRAGCEQSCVSESPEGSGRESARPRVS